MKPTLKDKQLNKAWQKSQKRLQKAILKEIERLKQDENFILTIDKEIEDSKGNIKEYIRQAFKLSKKEAQWKTPSLMKNTIKKS